MGGETPNNFWEIPADEWGRVVSVNSSGPFYMTRTVVPHMLAQGVGPNNRRHHQHEPPCTAKVAHPTALPKQPMKPWWALASRELEGTGVTVNVLVPGGMASTDLIPEDTDHQRKKMINPEVMQAPVVWLASDARTA
ncbi:MAG: hypothetical protein Ct9H300mP11_20210 [Chloroflexota bacterium]|nr:MAG: hypothetical protein Ct9H300mP11_20210 [Chloroflexota bacterium]